MWFWCVYASVQALVLSQTLLASKLWAWELLVRGRKSLNTEWFKSTCNSPWAKVLTHPVYGYEAPCQCLNRSSCSRAWLLLKELMLEMSKWYRKKNSYLLSAQDLVQRLLAWWGDESYKANQATIFLRMELSKLLPFFEFSLVLDQTVELTIVSYPVAIEKCEWVGTPVSCPGTSRGFEGLMHEDFNFDKEVQSWMGTFLDLTVTGETNWKGRGFFSSLNISPRFSASLP